MDGNVTKRQDLVQGLDSTTFTYDALDRVTICGQTGANDVNFATSHYDYDLNNNIQDTYRDEQAGKGERFGYDYANQLSSAVYNADNVQTPNPTNWDRTVSYTCDALNRTSMNDNGAITNYLPNGLNQLTNVSGQASQYDSNFNQKKLGSWNYTYDAARRLTNATNISTGQTVLFYYDGLNRCVKRITDSVTKHITYDGWKPIAEWGGNGALVAWNVYGPGPDEILMRYAPNLFPGVYLHYHADQFGSVKFILGTSNALLEKYSYDAFGAPKITDASGNVLTDSAYKNRFMFTGREYLSTIGIYEYRNRMYSPLLGRFLQTDPMEFDAGDNNLYRYCGNNPANLTDPSGLLDGGIANTLLPPGYRPSGGYDPAGPIIMGALGLVTIGPPVGLAASSLWAPAVLFLSTDAGQQFLKQGNAFADALTSSPGTGMVFDIKQWGGYSGTVSSAYNTIRDWYDSIASQPTQAHTSNTTPGSPPPIANPAATALNSVLESAAYRDANGFIYDANGNLIGDARSLFPVDSANVSGIAPAGIMSVPWPSAQMPSGIQP